MLLDPQDWALAHRIDSVLPPPPPEPAPSSFTRRDARLGAGDPDRRPRRRSATAIDGAGDAARRARRDARAARLRAASAGTHPFAVWQEIVVSARRALPVRLRLDARAGPARADLRAPRPRRRARPRGRDPRSPTGCAPTSRCCSRSRSTRPSGRGATPASPRRGRRSSRPSRGSGIPRAFADYADYVEAVDLLIRCDAVPGADLPLVGRAAAAALRHRRGADHGRADDAWPTPPRSPRWCSASSALEVEEGYAPRAARRRRRCSTRTASSPPATAMDAELIEPELEPRVPARELLADLVAGLPPARRGARLRGRARRRDRRSASAPAPSASSSTARPLARGRCRGGRRFWRQRLPCARCSLVARRQHELGDDQVRGELRLSPVADRARSGPRSRPWCGRRAGARHGIDLVAGGRSRRR